MNNPHRFLAAIALLAAVPSLGACSKPSADDPGNGQVVREVSRIEKMMEQARSEVRKEINEKNIRLSADDEKLPRAEITPSGDLMIGGDKVAIDAGQRQLLLEHRRNVADVAGAGAEIGLLGAELATKAMGDAFKSVFGGDTESMEQRIEAEAARIESQAALLCDRIPALLDSQRALAESLPEFRPYATMDGNDVGDCRKEVQSARNG